MLWCTKNNKKIIFEGQLFIMKWIEEKRLNERDKRGNQIWRKWGPYLSERQWGTVREDYSKEGAAWS